MYVGVDGEERGMMRKWIRQFSPLSEGKAGTYSVVLRASSQGEVVSSKDKGPIHTYAPKVKFCAL